jgi:hypothetical protein
MLFREIMAVYCERHESDLCEVGTGFLNTIWKSFDLQRIKKQKLQSPRSLQVTTDHSEPFQTQCSLYVSHVSTLKGPAV